MKNKIKATIVTMILLLTIIYSCTSITAATLKNKTNLKTTDEGFGNIDGIIKEWGDGPLDQAYVYVAGGHISLKDFDLSVVLAQNQSNQTGYYFINELPPGKYTLLVLRNGFGNKDDKYMPALRHTTVYSDETTTENFNLKKLGRNKTFPLLFQNHAAIYKIIFQKISNKIFI